jgi:hypothetical protein
MGEEEIEAEIRRTKVAIAERVRSVASPEGVKGLAPGGYLGC